MKRAVAALVLLFATQFAHAQAVHPNWEKGIAAEKAYEFGDIDTVNLFNGNLNVSIPIGQTYHLGGNLSYGLVLHYGGNNWEFADVVRQPDPQEPPKNFIWPYPSRRNNAGFGWRLSFGELTKDIRCSAFVPGLEWVYVSPDGATHCFYPKAHANDTPLGNVGYTGDSSYLRFDGRDSAQPKIEFPDGTYHLFDAQGRFTDMKDRFGNWMHVAYANVGPNDPPHWTITDSAARTHEVLFKNTAPYAEELGVEVGHSSVSEVDLAVAHGNTAQYTFHYEAETTNQWSLIPRHPISLSAEYDPDMPADTRVPLLMSIDMPEIPAWTFNYLRCTSVPEGDCPDSSGSLKSVGFPAGAQLSWTYQQFALEGKHFQTNPNKPLEGTLFETPTAVETRTMTYGGKILGTREYAQELDGTGSQSAILVTDHAGDLASQIIRRTRNYFSTCSDNCAYGVPGEYGLPLSRRPDANEDAGWFISSEDIGPNGNNWNSVLRRRFVKYEADVWLPSLATAFGSEYNKRLAAERTRYEDSKKADTIYSQFDGFGHYRQTTTDGTFGARNARTSFTNFNPTLNSCGADATTVVVCSSFPPGNPWILNTFASESVTEGASTAVTESCFDSNGFLTQRRMFGGNVNPANPTYLSTDLQAVFTHDHGNIVTEKYYGGDNGGASASSCTDPGSGEAYSLAHTWSSAGALLTSRYMTGNTTVLQVLDQDADPSTGFITQSRDTAGVATTFTYDKLGRLKTAAPATGTGTPSTHSATTTYTYSMNPPTVSVEQSTTETVPPLALSAMIFDGFGRLLKQQKTMPDETLSTVLTEYNGLGWKTRVSEAEGPGDPTNFTTFSYDPFGRPRVVTSPDGSKVTFAYTGVSQTARTVNVHTDQGDVDATTLETYDRQGKLWKVTEPNNVVTTYGYDVGNRLHSVCMNDGQLSPCQPRSFNYDNLGFLRSEQHPEKTNAVSYGYDARGHVIHRVDNGTELWFEYDRAERLRKVSEGSDKNTARPVKEFSFAPSNLTSPPDFRKGKLDKAIRHNWVTDKSTTPWTVFNFQVVESYEYSGRDGRASRRVTKEKSCLVTTTQDCRGELPGNLDLVQFSTAIESEPGGGTSQIIYPTCAFPAGCSSSITSAPTITNSYHRGLLESVMMPGGQSNTLAYLSNGLVSQVHHANSVDDWQQGDAYAMRRPSMLRVTGASDASACTSATIALQPASTTVTSGGGTTLSATINGDTDTASHPFTLQWYVGPAGNTGTQIGGQTITSNGPGSVTTTLPVTVASTTSYWLQASNGCGTAANSTAATVSVCNAVSITGQPSGTSVLSGQTATLTVTATGSSLRYQWYVGTSGNISNPVEGATSASLSFIPTQTASYWVRVYNDCPGPQNSNAVAVTVTPPPAPASLVASYQPTGGILVSWNAVTTPAGVRNYILQRGYNRTGFHDYRTLAGTTLSYLDPDAAADHAYIYRVRIVDGNGVGSSHSNVDVATAISFTDDAAVAGATLIRGVHFAELRKAIDAVRTAANLPAIWTSYDNLTGVVLAAQVNEMRTALAQARSTLGLTAVTYPTPSLIAGSPILASDLQQMRGGVK